MRKRKVFITIPAYNEEKTIGKVIKSIPRKIKGVEEVKVLVWDDGSTDNTFKVAKQSGADYVFRNKKNLGLAKTFHKAVKKAVDLGADIIVNVDADDQYDQKEIPKLIEPILQDKADLVNGDRQVKKLSHMPFVKKWGNVLGTTFINWLTGLRLKDASSGFRAYTKEVIESFKRISSHTYTHETLIQAAFNDFVIEEVPVKFKKRKFGSSRLITSVPVHIFKSVVVILRAILMYKALIVFTTLGGGIYRYRGFRRFEIYLLLYYG